MADSALPAPAPVLLQHAADIAAELPLPAGWPRKGRVWPTRSVWLAIKREWRGRAAHTITLSLPQTEHRGLRLGQRTSNADQPATVVPLTWMVELAKRVGCPLAQLVRGRIEDDVT